MLDTQTPLVSVLVPICNVERYLHQCLESARTQTLKNIEVICINDGSTDGSLNIINEFASQDERFKVIDKPNSGYGDSMNKGLEAAQGRYIAILESDDYLDPDALEYMVGEAETHNLEVLKCNFWLYWSKALPEHEMRHTMYFPLATPDMVLMGAHAPMDFPKIFWAKASIWSALYKRSFLEENNIKFLPTPGASFQDLSFTFKVLSHAKRLAYSGRAFLHYRQDNEGSSVNSKGKVYCVCDEHEEIKRFLEQDCLDLAPVLHPIRAYTKFLNYRWNYERLGDQFKAEFLERFRKEMAEEVQSGYIPATQPPAQFAEAAELDNFHYFADWEYEELQEILHMPDFWVARRACVKSANKVNTLKTYWSAGGPSYVLRALRTR